MWSTLVSFVAAFCLLWANVFFDRFGIKNTESRLICVSEFIQYLSFGFNTQISDSLWVRFLQELDAYNESGIATPHLCPDRTSSWHFHIINAAMNMDHKFYEISVMAPLLISITIGDTEGASVLFDKAVTNFPNDWKVLYRASYQAQIEEKNKSKAADLLYRAGKNGAPNWVMSLAGGLFNDTGNREMAEQIYKELLTEEKNVDVANRLKLKLEKKMKNYFESVDHPSNQKEEK